ncbi:MAG: TonB-dependent receptor [Bacteroidota bacterium]
MKHTSISFFFLFLAFAGWGQSLTGRILDQQQLPLIGAHILQKNGNGHAHSDESGRFELQDVAIGDTLEISYFGFLTLDTVIQSLDSPFRVKLKETSLQLAEIVIQPNTDALQLIADIDLAVRPVNSSQEILRQVPGLFIGQHAGGGKAEQIFLRGFDIDHGTDINITVDGIPVNMVSHAHGQGYADLHFLIPETIERIEFGKGPYFAEQGNFNTAGYVDFRTKTNLESSLIKQEIGQFNTQRTLAMLDLTGMNQSDRHQAYIAGEFLRSDGAFESPQNFSRINVLGKYTANLNPQDQISVTFSHFLSDWDASGQIPQRAVDDGSITRFGAIDDTEGGETKRTNVQFQYNKFLTDRSLIRTNLFYSYYDFELYSNFTFFLEDPVNGDQIRQREVRNLFGVQSEYVSSFELGSITGDWKAGISLRTDNSDNNELSWSTNRTETREQIQFGDVRETNMSVYAAANFNLGDFRINPGLRVDYFDFNYIDDLATAFTRLEATDQVISPHLNILYTPSSKVQLYVKSGVGFHSNDTRVVVQQQAQQTLPRALGADVGAIWKPGSKWFVQMAYWYLFLEQEFVYVGDAGIVEPSGETRRLGIESSIRYQALPWLMATLDVNYTYARSIDAGDGEDLIPLAPDFTLVGGVNIDHPSGWQGGLNVRHLGDRPANENNSIIAEGYTVVDLNASYRWKRFRVGFQIENLFDVDWNETQFATESRLFDEVESVEEIHFTPGVPFFFRGFVEFRF